MVKQGTFGAYEATCMVLVLMITKIFYTSFSIIVEIEGTAAWYGTLISCLVSLFFFYLLYLLMKRFPGHNITQIFEIVLGKIAGKAVTLIFSAYILYYSAANLREFIEMIKTYNLPYTPPSILIFGFIAVAAILAYYGLEGLARTTGILFIPVILGVILILVLASPLYDIDYIKPYLGYGIKETLIASFLRSSSYEEFFSLAIMINSLHGLKAFKKIGTSCIIITGIIFSVNLLCYLMSFIYSLGIENLSGLFQMSRLIYFSRYVQRLESIFLFSWIIASLLSVSISFYISISVYNSAFEINDHRPVIYPFAFLLFMLTLLPQNISEVIQINFRIIRQYSMFFVYFVPVIVLIIAVITRKRGECTDA